MLAIFTAMGDARGDAGHPALRAGALILTTAAGARRLHGRLLPGQFEPAELLTVRLHGSCLFLRYGLQGSCRLPA